MKQVQESLEQIRSRTMIGELSQEVVITTSVESTDDGIQVIEASALFMLNGEQCNAKSTRTIDTAGHDETAVSQFIAACKRDALRDLVTQLQLHEVL